jgi:ribosomal protein S6--L-glutamate ligase
MSVPRIWVLTDRTYLDQRMPLAVVVWLSGHSAPSLVIADRGGGTSQLAPAGAPDDTSVWDGLRARDFVVARSRHPLAIALLQEAEALGARICDRWSSVLRVQDKVSCTLALVKKGLPVPPTFLAHRPEDLRRVPARLFPLLLKPVTADDARGLRMVQAADELGSVSWGDDFVLAQHYVDAGGFDLKLYVAGETVWAIRRLSPLLPGRDQPLPVPVTPALQDLVRGCREEFGLTLFGLDVLESRNGPVIVDVNEFPNYTAVEEAPAVIGQLLLQKTATEGAVANN